MSKMRKRAEEIAQGAKEMMEELGELPPHFIIEADGDGASSLVMCAWKDEEDKRDMLDTIRMFMKMNGTTHYFMVSEAWVLTNQEAPTDGRSFEHVEGREEMLIVIGVSHAEKISHQFKIIRDGKLVALAPAEQIECAGGRMVELLPRPGERTTPEEVSRVLRSMRA